MSARATDISLLLLALAACGEKEPRPRDLAEDVAALAASGVVGVQVEQVVGAVHSWASAGVSDLHRRSDVQPDSRYRIAGTTKTFVAALTLRLVDDGVLELDDALGDWLPEITAGSDADGAAITLRHLLSHRSGLADHTSDLSRLLSEAGSEAAFMALLQRPWSPAELVALSLAHGVLDPPGVSFHYSDTNYVLVGMIIEAATGAHWEDELARRVLIPLGLQHTLAPRDSAVIPGTHMHGYTALPFQAGYRDVTGLSPSSLHAAGALVSTPADVNRFFSALLGGELLSASALRAMKTLEPGGDRDDPSSYGLGLVFTPLDCGGGYYGHPGDTFGFHTRNAVSEDGRRSVCIALSGDGDFDRESSALIERVLCEGR